MERTINVLMVDDETDFLEPVAFWLKSKGYAVTTLTSGEEAVELVKRAPPDVVFLDINMPGIDGIETLRRIRALTRDLPVVMVTAAYQDEKNISQASSLGIAGFFPKNNSLSELVRVIETCLRVHTKLKSPSP
ncbi:MAG: response regulator [Candidatus Omnitrophica bacterium]|nr:response regulator [Candidatus Omnitrophota bacterium]